VRLALPPERRWRSARTPNIPSLPESARRHDGRQSRRKPGVHALFRLHPGRGVSIRRSQRLDSEYQRAGTRNFRRVQPQKRSRHRLGDARPNGHLRALVSRSRATVVSTRATCDHHGHNVSKRTGRPALAWLRRDPRVEFLFNPEPRKLAEPNRDLVRHLDAWRPATLVLR